MKILVPGVGCLPMKSRSPPRIPKQYKIEVTAIDFGCPAELGDKPLFTKENTEKNQCIHDLEASSLLDTFHCARNSWTSWWGRKAFRAFLLWTFKSQRWPPRQAVATGTIVAWRLWEQSIDFRLDLRPFAWVGTQAHCWKCNKKTLAAEFIDPKRGNMLLMFC